MFYKILGFHNFLNYISLAYWHDMHTYLVLLNLFFIKFGDKAINKNLNQFIVMLLRSDNSDLSLLKLTIKMLEL